MLSAGTILFVSIRKCKGILRPNGKKFYTGKTIQIGGRRVFYTGKKYRSGVGRGSTQAKIQIGSRRGFYTGNKYRSGAGGGSTQAKITDRESAQ